MLLVSTKRKNKVRQSSEKGTELPVQPYGICRLTPQNILLEKLIVSQLLKNFPPFYETRNFITAFKISGHLSLYRARKKPVQAPPIKFLEDPF
jgi:hypothetical protein